MKKLLPLALVGCTQVRSNGEHTDRCDSEIQAMVEACEDSSVIGSNPNQPLYDARDALKECLGDVKVICSDTGFTKVLTITNN